MAGYKNTAGMDPREVQAVILVDDAGNSGTAGGAVLGGQTASGSAVTGNPVRIGIKDSNGSAQDVTGTTAGAINVNQLALNNIDDAVASYAAGLEIVIAPVTIGSSIATLDLTMTSPAIGTTVATGVLPGIADVTYANVWLDNESGQTINSLTLTTSKVVNTRTASRVYTAANVSVTNAQANPNDGSGNPYVIPFVSGKLDTMKLTVGFAVNASSGTVAALVILSAQPMVTSDGALRVNQEGAKATYSASVTGLASVASATDIFTIKGSATKTIRVTHLEVDATQTTGAIQDILLIVRSAADTGGTSTNPTAVPHDSNNPAATAVLNAYTGNPSLGAAVGTIRADKIFIPATTADTILSEDFGTRNTQSIVLRGTAQQLAVNLNGVTITGGSFDLDCEWTEE